MRYKYAILTTIFDKDEKPREVPFRRDDVELVLVTDNINIKSDVWKVIYVNGDIFSKEIVRHDPFFYVSSDVCIWMDSNYQLVGDPTDNFVIPFINSQLECRFTVNGMKHNVFEQTIYNTMHNGDGINYDCSDILTIFKHVIPEKTSYYIADTLIDPDFFIVKKTNTMWNLFEQLKKFYEEYNIHNMKNDDAVISLYITMLYYRWDKLEFMNPASVTDNPYFKRCEHNTMYLDKAMCIDKIAFNEEQNLYEIK